MNQLTRPLFLVSPRFGTRWPRQLIDAMRFKHALDGPIAEIELAGDPHGAATLLTQLQGTSDRRLTDPRRRVVRTPTLRRQPGQVIGRIAIPPARQHLACNAE